MQRQDHRIYEFGNFRLDLGERILSREGQTIPLRPKLFDLLLFLIENCGQLLKKDEITSAVWGGVSQGTPDQPAANLTVNISSLRQILGDNADKAMFIETVAPWGYRFIAPVKLIQPDTSNQFAAEKIADPQVRGGAEEAERKPQGPMIGRGGWVLVLSAAILLLLTLGGFWFMTRQRNPSGPDLKNQRQVVLSPADEESVRRVVKESQFFETLTIYTNPEAFQKEQLKTYWLPADQGGKAITIVEKIVAGLLKKGYHYGSESKNIQFDFRYVRIYSPRDYAEVGTIEKWYVPAYNKDNSRVLDKNVYLGPYTVDYSLDKVNGVWLLEENSTPRPKTAPAATAGQ